MKILLIDMTNLARKNAFADIKAHPFDAGVWIKWSSRTVNDIMDFIRKFEADRCILAMDAKRYWRHSVYPDYKINRRQFKKNAIIDFDNFDTYYENFMRWFSDTFSSIYCLNIRECEADDIIAVLTKHHSESGDHCTIVSADKDFNQLKKYKNVVHYNPVMHKEIVMLNPQRSLDIKVICGDINDGIPAIRKGVGVKTAEKIINSHVDIPNSSDTLLVENYRRNRILIDFDFIPKEISSTIILEYEKTEIKPIVDKKVFDFAIKCNSFDIVESWQKNKERLSILR